MNISKLCRNDIEKICAYCEFSGSEIDNTTVICKKKGSVAKTSKCIRFKYNPLKRIPPKRATLKIPKGDFSL